MILNDLLVTMKLEYMFNYINLPELNSQWIAIVSIVLFMVTCLIVIKGCKWFHALLKRARDNNKNNSL